ncbi:YciI family protein [Christiangramia sediminis]|uniref:YciI family protein n=1 Tax=Christiangramia sediminis TaxID=2881336 RepID=A0A9X1LKI3_9FLAO|nr:YciI family protein [Christiangramia sediminis]MCB7481980.1 YciI family protein [Christiangramia sediminis]
MKKLLFLMLLGLGISCVENSNKDTVVNEENETRDSLVKKSPDMDQIEADLKNMGYQTFKYKEGDTTYLMQQYYMVFLKAGPTRSQDSTEAAELQKQHMAHLTRMYEEGYTSLTGPMGDDGELRGMVLFNTATQKEADSLANLDPMVKAGRLTVEVHPWWVAKGGKLK